MTPAHPAPVHGRRPLPRTLAATAALALAVTAAGPATAAPTHDRPTPPGQAQRTAPAAQQGGGKGGPHAASPDAEDLAPQLADQELAWEDCGFEAPAGPDAAAPALDAPGLACADVEVPLDWDSPEDGRTITVRISKVPASDPAARQGIMMINPGGPGGPGLEMAPYLADSAPEVAAAYDMIGFDPRGVGRSTPLTCQVPSEAMMSQDPATGPRAIADACRAEPLAPFITTEQTVHDMDLIRAVLDEDQTSYLGYSYGTWLGSWYQRTFPQNAGRFVLDSSTDLTRKSLEETWDLQPYAFERQFAQVLLPYAARHGEQYGLSGTAEDLYRQFEEAGGTRTETGQLVGMILAQLMYSADNYPVAAELLAAYLNGELDDAAGLGDAVAQAGLDARLAGVDPRLADALEDVPGEGAPGEEELPEYLPFAGAMPAIQCQDGRWQHSTGYWQAQRDKLARTAPFAGGLFSALPVCAFWPATEEMPKPGNHKTHPETLILQSEMDPATDYAGGARSAKLLPNTTLVSVDDEVSHGVYPYGSACVDDVVERYLLTGERPRRNVVCQGHALPGDDAPMEYDGGVRAEAARRG